MYKQYPVLFLSLTTLTACGDNTKSPLATDAAPPADARPDAPPDAGKIVKIAAGDVTHLVSIVGDPAFAGYRIELAPGTYPVTTPLVLQPNQTLVGAQTYVDRDGDGLWDPQDAAQDPAAPGVAYAAAGTETILDVGGRTADVAVTLTGGDVLANLTVRGAGKLVESAAPFDIKFLVNLGAASGSPAAVNDCILEAGYHALGADPTAAGSYTAAYARNIVRDNVEGATLGADVAEKVVLTATLDHNRLMGGVGDATLGQFGLSVAFRSASQNRIMLTTTGNAIDENAQAGVSILGGFTTGPTTMGGAAVASSSDNVLVWTSTNDAIWRNGNPAAPVSSGGLFLSGSWDNNPAGTATTSNDNDLTLNFTGTQLVKPGSTQQNAAGGMRSDLVVFGAAAPACGPLGHDNHVTLSFTGVTSDDDAACGAPTGCSTLVGLDSYTVDTTQNNSVTFMPLDATAFAAANTKLLAPAHYPSAGQCAPPSP